MTTTQKALWAAVPIFGLGRSLPLKDIEPYVRREQAFRRWEATRRGATR